MAENLISASNGHTTAGTSGTELSELQPVQPSSSQVISSAQGLVGLLTTKHGVNLGPKGAVVTNKSGD
jgi:hypothetical protein